MMGDAASWLVRDAKSRCCIVLLREFKWDQTSLCELTRHCCRYICSWTASSIYWLCLMSMLVPF